MRERERERERERRNETKTCDKKKIGMVRRVDQPRSASSCLIEIFYPKHSTLSFVETNFCSWHVNFIFRMESMKFSVHNFFSCSPNSSNTIFNNNNLKIRIKILTNNNFIYDKKCIHLSTLGKGRKVAYNNICLEDTFL